MQRGFDQPCDSLRQLDVPSRSDGLAEIGERSRRMEAAWRDRNKTTQQDANDARPRTPSLDQSRAAAEQAYVNRNVRMQNAWRHE
jgi:hypothetical protein